MIVIKLELWPKGDENRKRDLGSAHIIHQEMADDHHANYLVKLLKGTEYSKHPGTLYKSTIVNRFKRQLGPWLLIQTALNQIFPCAF